jgi:uracil-DNA glycosylase family 4
MEKDLSICQKCQLFKDERITKPCMGGFYSHMGDHEIKKECEFMVVIESPTAIDEALELAYADERYSSFFRNSLNSIGIEDYYVTYACKCNVLKPNSTKRESIPPNPAQVKACNKYLKKEMDIIRPKYVVLFGNSSMVATIKKSGIGKYHGKTYNIDGVIYMPTFDPKQVKQNQRLLVPFVEDMNIFESVIKSGGNIRANSTPVDYKYVDSMDRVRELFSELVRAKLFAFDIEAPSSNAWRATPIFKTKPAVLCISFSTKPNSAWVLPLDHKDTPFTKEELTVIKAALKKIMEDPSIFKIAHNGKFDINYIRVVLGIQVQGFIFDTMLASYLLNENPGVHGLKDLALRFTDVGDYEMDLEKLRKSYKVPIEVKGKTVMHHYTEEEYNYSLIDMSVLFNYAACDADVTMRLLYILRPKLAEEGVLSTLDLLLTISTSITEIEFNGAKMDIAYAQKATEEYGKELNLQLEKMRKHPDVKFMEEYYAYINALKWLQEKYKKMKEKDDGTKLELFDTQTKLWGMGVPEFFGFIDKMPLKDRVGFIKAVHLKEPNNFKAIKYQDFNFNSGNQLADLIYGFYGEPVKKKTESGAPATDEEVINSLVTKYDFFKEIATYKKMEKFYNTYLAPSVPEWLCEDGMIHSNYLVHGTETGRLSSKAPNMQNLPRDDKVIKKMIVSRFKNGVIMNADYSQIELRVLAIYSKDEKLIAFYLSGKDLHTQTARTIIGPEIFDALDKAEKKRYRQIFKSINFLIVYGGSAKALAAQVGITKEKAQEYMTMYFEKFPGVINYIEEYKNFATNNKFVWTLTKRKRRLPNVDSDKDGIREAALRMAINTPIQSTASDITQVSISRVQQIFKQLSLQSLVIGTVHDSMIVDVHPDEIQTVATIINTVFANPPQEFCKDPNTGAYIVPFLCDIEIGERYGEGTDIKFVDNEWKYQKEHEDGTVTYYKIAA